MTGKYSPAWSTDRLPQPICLLAASPISPGFGLIMIQPAFPHLQGSVSLLPGQGFPLLPHIHAELTCVSSTAFLCNVMWYLSRHIRLQLSNSLLLSHIPISVHRELAWPGSAVHCMPLPPMPLVCILLWGTLLLQREFNICLDQNGQ